MPTDERAIVVIPAWNAASTIGAQLAALARQEYAGGWRVIVADDGSTDDTVAAVESAVSTFPVPLSVLRLGPPNRGSAAARNAAVRVTDEQLILFCDADDEVRTGWIAALAAALAKADGAGGRLELDRLNSPEMLRWAAPTRAWERDWLVTSEWGLPSPIGACSAIRREAWSAVGGFDERLGSRGEDIDLFWRLQRLGGSLAFAPNAVVSYRLAPDRRTLLRKLYASGRAHTVVLRSFHHPKRRRQLAIQVAGAIRRSHGVLRRDQRPAAVYDLVMVAGRVRGLLTRSGTDRPPVVPPASVKAAE